MKNRLPHFCSPGMPLLAFRCFFWSLPLCPPIWHANNPNSWYLCLRIYLLNLYFMMKIYLSFLLCLCCLWHNAHTLLLLLVAIIAVLFQAHLVFCALLYHASQILFLTNWRSWHLVLSKSIYWHHFLNTSAHFVSLCPIW